jgi:hypothetical protein
VLLPLGAFAAVVHYHTRVRRERACTERAAELYRAGIGRIENRWIGRGATGDRFEDPRHVYAADLDLFGRGGLFELLSRARTRMGENTLAAWLLAPSPVDEIRARQAAVAELGPALDLREDLAVLGHEPAVGVRPDALTDWAEAANAFAAPWLRWLPPALAVLALATAVVWGVFGTVSPFLAVLLVEGALTYRLRKPLAQVLYGVEHAFEDLDLLAAVLARVERERFEAPRLRALMQSLRSRAVAGFDELRASHEVAASHEAAGSHEIAGPHKTAASNPVAASHDAAGSRGGAASHDVAASDAIAQLRTIVQFVESRRNVFVRLIDVPLMYSVQLARAAEAWRARHGTAVRKWLHAAGEIEALVSLGVFHYEHPADPFPDFVEGRAVFDARGLCHPLIPASTCVRNDVEVGDGARVLLVSGSNMSGKSTLLRAVGLNTVLAMAGATVRAERLTLAPLQVGASIRINDSLQEGSSRFYAEITRLKAILDLAGRKPALLFLLDELLQGTNSKDRRIGAEGVLHALAEHGAIGMVSTHDLALTDIGATGGAGLRNMHFQDEIEDGRMTFDFKLREGVVAKSNGIELMRSVGLDV